MKRTFQPSKIVRKRRHGFRLVDLNDGRRNVEGEPDALYVWRQTFSTEGL